MRRYLLILSIVISASTLYAGITDSLSIGLAGGYSSYNTFRGELYLKTDLKLFDKNAELKVGMNNRSYRTPLLSQNIYKAKLSD